MNQSSRSGLILLAGVVLLIATGVANAVFIDARLVVYLLGIAGIVLCGWGAFGSRAGIGELVRQRRGEVALYTIGLVGVLIMAAWLSARFPVRFDMTENRQFSLSPATEAMLDRLEKPVHIVFFNDRMMRETIEIYEQMARRTDKLTVEFFDPMLNPAQARMRGVEFAGTAIFESEGRKLTVNGPSETDIANGILRISQGVQQTVCFLEGHGEPDPFSLESHDHTEGNAGHSHGLGSKLVLHERHGIAKARHGLEAMNYVVEKVSLLQGTNNLAKCAVLVVAGPKIPLLPAEVKAIDKYLVDGGNALFMLDPFIRSGVEPVLLQYGIIPDEDIVLDEASHFWADISAPAVTDYNRHEVTRELPLTFFPGVRSLSPTAERVPGTDVRPVINSSRKSYGGTDRDRANFDPKTSKPGPLTLMVTANRRPNFVESTEAVVRRLRDGNPQAQAEARKEDADKAKNVSRIAVIGDSDFATNSFFHILGNGTLFLNTVNFLAAKENLIGLEPRTYDLPHVNLTNTQMNGTFFLSIVFIPALMAVIGLIVWWRQR
ncbi:MAG TPA: GldG family protein [Burkholderiales bacterium]